MQPPQDATAEERRQFLEKQRPEREAQQSAYTEARKGFSLALLLVAAPVGIAAVVLGSIIPLHSIGAGLTAGGALSITMGYRMHWEYVDDRLRFLSLLAGLVVLLIIGYRHRPTGGPA